MASTTCVIGENNTGKSNFLHATDRLDHAIIGDGATKWYGLVMDFCGEAPFKGQMKTASNLEGGPTPSGATDLPERVSQERLLFQERKSESEVGASLGNMGTGYRARRYGQFQNIFAQQRFPNQIPTDAFNRISPVTRAIPLNFICS